MLPSLVVSVLAFLPPQAGAAPTARFTRLSVEQGLSQSTVQAIVQDRVGFVWLGTEEGLNRYDGYSFLVFKHDPHNPGSLPDDVVTQLYEDHQQRLWIGTDHGLSFFDRRTETFVPVAVIHGKVYGIAETHDGTLWIASEGEGLFERKLADGVFVLHQHEEQNPASLASNAISALLCDREGRVWVGTRDRGVDMLVPGSGRFVHYQHDAKAAHSLTSGGVRRLAEDLSGNLWVAVYGGGLSVLDPKTGTFRNYQHKPADPRGLPTDEVTTVFVDRLGAVWVGTDGRGVQKYEAATGRFTVLLHDPADPFSLSQNVVRAISEDTQGQLWVGTYLGGVSVLKKTHPFAYFTPNSADPSSLSDPPGSFMEDAQGRVWIGTGECRLNRFDEKTGKFVRHYLSGGEPGKKAILSLLQDRHGHIWAGMFHGGLGRFDPVTGSFSIYQHRPDDPTSIGNDEVWRIAEDKEGTLWLGTNTGVDHFDPRSGTVTMHYDEHASQGLGSGVRALMFDRQGSLWVGTIGGGIHVLPPGSDHFIRYQHDERNPNSLSDNRVVALYQDHRGDIWAGTFGGGMDHLDLAQGSFTTYREPSSFIYSIQEDSSGHLWLSTNHGLSRFDPPTGHAENFDLTNGLQSVQFRPGASLRMRNGHILFASVDGFYVIAPEAIQPDTYAPPVVLASLHILNEAKPRAAPSVPDEIALSYDDRFFSLEFAALDYTFPRHNRYAYIMEGVSDQWIELGEKHDITFTNLDPGTHVLRVKASNSDGIWKDASVATLRVIVHPPFWKTWWFRGLSLALLAVAIVAGHRLRVRRLTRDLAERRQVEQTLRSLEERFSKAFHANPAAMSIQRFQNEVFIDVNESYVRLLGYGRDEIINRRPVEIGILDSEQNQRSRRLLLEHGCLRDTEFLARSKSGESRAILSSQEIIDLDGEKCVLGAHLDITERKRLEAQLRQAQKMEAIGRLAGGVAHDFNNLLTIIHGSSELLRDEIAEPSLGERIDAIRNASKKAASLIRQLLTFSRRQIFQLQTLDLNDVLSDLGKMLRRLVSEDIEVSIVTTPALGPIRGDQSQIEQVIVNLAINASDSMPQGGKLTLETAHVHAADVRARCHTEPAQDLYVRLTVMDTGCGMDAETQSHIFEPFFTTKEEGKGTGLGLATVYAVVQQAGGYIALQSAPREGSVFYVYFPQASGPSPGKPAEPSDRVLHGTETILVVEDNEEICKLTCDILRRNGYSVLSARNGREAGPIFTKHQNAISLVITDIVMPEMGGQEFAASVRSLQPETRVLFMSSYAQGKIHEPEPLTRDAAFIQKPFSREALLHRVREILDAPPQVVL